VDTVLVATASDTRPTDRDELFDPQHVASSIVCKATCAVRPALEDLRMLFGHFMIVFFMAIVHVHLPIANEHEHQHHEL
jgi:hypothetical protein